MKINGTLNKMEKNIAKICIYGCISIFMLCCKKKPIKIGSLRPFADWKVLEVDSRTLNLG